MTFDFVIDYLENSEDDQTMESYMIATEGLKDVVNGIKEMFTKFINWAREKLTEIINWFKNLVGPKYIQRDIASAMQALMPLCQNLIYVCNSMLAAQINSKTIMKDGDSYKRLVDGFNMTVDKINALQGKYKLKDPKTFENKKAATIVEAKDLDDKMTDVCFKLLEVLKKLERALKDPELAKGLKNYYTTLHSACEITFSTFMIAKKGIHNKNYFTE